jgi:hypothetical protein
MPLAQIFSVCVSCLMVYENYALKMWLHYVSVLYANMNVTRRNLKIPEVLTV